MKAIYRNKAHLHQPNTCNDWLWAGTSGTMSQSKTIFLLSIWSSDKSEYHESFSSQENNLTSHNAAAFLPTQELIQFISQLLRHETNSLDVHPCPEIPEAATSLDKTVTPNGTSQHIHPAKLSFQTVRYNIHYVCCSWSPLEAKGFTSFHNTSACKNTTASMTFAVSHLASCCPALVLW